MHQTWTRSMAHEKIYYESYQYYFFFWSWVETHAHDHTHSYVLFIFFFFLLFIWFCSHWRLAKHIYEHRYIHVCHPYTKWISPAVASTRRVANRNMFIVHSVEQKKKQQKKWFHFFVILFVYCFRILVVHIGIYRLSHSRSMLNFCTSSNSILHPFQCIGLYYYIIFFCFFFRFEFFHQLKRQKTFRTPVRNLCAVRECVCVSMYVACDKFQCWWCVTKMSKKWCRNVCEQRVKSIACVCLCVRECLWIQMKVYIL